ncbi:MAG: SEC-C metal-binding domain-containing protein [Lentisphaeria bacterium]|nr:SEC-C metal-binding domain-containing protein [Lentisphaeria bacterium]
MSKSDQPGRNDPCHCGSGRKYKKCCLPADEEKHKADLQQAAEEAEALREEEELYRSARLSDLYEDPEPEKWEEEAFMAPLPDRREDLKLKLPAAGVSLDSPPARDYPEPPEPPEPDEEMAAFVDNWWEEQFMPVYQTWNLDAILDLLEDVLANRPDAVPYLHLHEECLIELSGKLATAENPERLANWLLALRETAPVAYDQVFGYLDCALVEYMIATGRTRWLSGLLDRFAAYPASEPDSLADTVNLLLLTNHEAEVMALANATGVPCACSPKVMGMGPTFQWVETAAAAHVYQRASYTMEDAADWVAALDALDLPFDHGMTVAEARYFLTLTFAPMDWNIPVGEEARSQFLGSLCNHYRVWLNCRKNLSFLSARFFAHCLVDLYYDAPPVEKSFRDPLRPHPQAVEKHICANLKRFFSVDNVSAYGLLFALHWFADFLFESRRISAAERDAQQNQWLKLYEKAKPVLCADSNWEFFTTFPEYPYAETSRDLNELEGMLG